MEKYFRNKQVIDGEIDNQQIMLHLENGKYYGLNPVAKRVWDLLEKPLALEEILEILLSEFEVSEGKCRGEVKLFLDNAVKAEIILKSEMD